MFPHISIYCHWNEVWAICQFWPHSQSTYLRMYLSWSFQSHLLSKTVAVKQLSKNLFAAISKWHALKASKGYVSLSSEVVSRTKVFSKKHMLVLCYYTKQALWFPTQCIITHHCHKMDSITITVILEVKDIFLSLLPIRSLVIKHCIISRH